MIGRLSVLAFTLQITLMILTMVVIMKENNGMEDLILLMKMIATFTGSTMLEEQEVIGNWMTESKMEPKTSIMVVTSTAVMSGGNVLSDKSMITMERPLTMPLTSDLLPLPTTLKV